MREERTGYSKADRIIQVQYKSATDKKHKYVVVKQNLVGLPLPTQRHEQTGARQRLKKLATECPRSVRDIYSKGIFL